MESIYEELKKDQYTRYVGNIGLDVLKEKYAYFHEILRDNHYKKNVSEYDDDAFIQSTIYTGVRLWDAYAVNKRGEVEEISLYHSGNTHYTSEDERMKELADWIDSILREDVEMNKVRSQELRTEYYYDEIIENLKQKYAE